jgi:glycosyltransferase involved in cell wall biosynthesis
MKGFVLAIVAEIVSLVCGRRCFLTFHAGIEQVYFPRPKYPLLLPVFRTLFMLPRAIICNSEEVKAKIVEYGVSPRKIVPIPAFSRQYLESGGDPLPAEVEAFFGRFKQVVFCYMKMRPLFFPEATIDGFAGLAAKRPDVGLLLCGIVGHMEEGIWPAVQARLAVANLRGRVLVVDDLPHQAFLQALGRATVCLRTHLSDGVCSSVMEALSLGVPVVATENQNRPPGVITYDPRDPVELTTLLGDVLARREQIAAQLPRPEVRDTLAEEAELLTA